MTNTDSQGRPEVLLLEDSDDDAALIARQLSSAGLRCTLRRASTVAEIEALVAARRLDLVISDFRLPPSDGFDVLLALRAVDPDMPVIFVSGAIGEEIAANLMRAGARDFVSKRHLARLPTAVERELREAAIRREHRTAQQALRASEAQHRNLLATLPVGVFRLALDGGVEAANPCLLEMLGCNQEHELLGRHWTEFVANSDQDLLPSEVPEEIGTEPVEVELAIRRLDRTEFWGHVRLRASPPEDRLTRHVDGTLADATARHVLEDALRRGKEEWERTFDAVHELIMLTGPTLVIERVNQAVAQRLGVHPRDAVGKPWTELVAQKLPPVDLRHLIDVARSGHPVEFDLVSERLGGEFRFSATPRIEPSGVIVGAILVGRDVTAQRQVAEMLQRQVAVDQAEHIFRTFRHETGNAMNTLKTTLSVFRQSFETFDSDKRNTYFARCFESLRIAESLLAALRSYQTLDRVTLCQLDMAAVLEARSDLLFATARAQGVDCSFHAQPGPHPVAADVDALVRVLLNVIDNALAATRERAEPRIEMVVQSVNGYAAVVVSDNGVGIAPDVLPRIFQPLFTTRPEGTGMGLAIVQKLMLRMNGVATVHSVPEQGTVVELRFPGGGGQHP